MYNSTNYSAGGWEKTAKEHRAATQANKTRYLDVQHEFQIKIFIQYMCDDPQELLATVLNVYIPEILPRLSNYVVKGGRASDYYIHKTRGGFITFTDWDIACTEETLESNCRLIIDFLSTKGIRVNKDIIILEENRGYQLGFDCGKMYYFIDVIAYPSDNKIFMHIKRDTINYVDYDYLLSDLAQTYRDRIHNLNVWLSELKIYNVTVNENDYEMLLEAISTKLTTILRETFERDKIRIQTDTSLTKEEINEDFIDLATRYDRDIVELNTITIPDLRERFEKLLRTKIRYERLQRSNKKKKPYTRRAKSPNAKRTRISYT